MYDEATSSFIVSQYTLDQATDGCIMATAAQTADVSRMDFAVGIWNDDAPPTASPSTVPSSYAHSKGILMTDTASGFLLTHSMPNWPNPRGFPLIPFPDDSYAQSISCVTISPDTADSIAVNLQLDKTFLITAYISPYMQQRYTRLSSWLFKVPNTLPTTASVVPFVSAIKGEQFYHFGKAAAWGQDLWDDLVSPYFGTALNVETWRSGAGGRMGSMCGSTNRYTPYDINVVSTVSMSDGVWWGGTSDHSKWAVSTTTRSSAVGSGTNSVRVSCVGDINRMCSQESRGGGAICNKNVQVWSAFNSIVYDTEPCFQVNPCLGSSTKCFWCSASFTPIPSAIPTRLPTNPQKSLMTPFSSPTPSPMTSDTITKASLGKATIASIVVGVFVFLISCVLGYMACRNRKKQGLVEDFQSHKDKSGADSAAASASSDSEVNNRVSSWKWMNRFSAERQKRETHIRPSQITHMPSQAALEMSNTIRRESVYPDLSSHHNMRSHHTDLDLSVTHNSAFGNQQNEQQQQQQQQPKTKVVANPFHKSDHHQHGHGQGSHDMTHQL